jgi:hypothetical protein
MTGVDCPSTIPALKPLLALRSIGFARHKIDQSATMAESPGTTP